MRNKVLKRRLKLALVFCISILVVTILALATSYALFRLNVTKDTDFKIKVGNLELTIDDTNLGNTITDGKIVMSGLEPMKEQDGLALTGYNFKLKNTGTIDADYSVYLDSAIIQGESKGRISDSLIKVNLTNNTTHASQTYTFSDLTNVAIDTGSLATNGENSYTLKMWLDYSADNTAQDKYFAVQIRVDGIQSNSVIDNTLKGQILRDNTLVTTAPTLTTNSNNANDTSGLYKMSVTNGFGGQDGDTYYFRGNVDNNKVKFANLDWRIVRINEDGTVRLILDEAINATSYIYASSGTGASYMYYTNSTIKATINNWFTTNLNSYSSQIASGNYFCESARVTDGDGAYNTVAGSTFIVSSFSYTPDLVCSTDANAYRYVNSNIGLITYDEVIFAGGNRDTTGGYNYYLHKNYEWHTMTPGGIKSSNVARVWSLSVDGNLYTHNVTGNEARIRPVINLISTVTATKDANGVYVID